MKTNGFNLENQAFTAPHKIELLMSILVLVYAMAIYEGVIIHQTEQVKIKTYKVKGNKGLIHLIFYPEKSVFRAGLAFIEDIILNVKKLIEYLHNIVLDYFIENQYFKL